MPTNKERKYVDWLIRQIREDSGARSALAKGDVPRREGMAEALIIPHAGGWNIDARRLHAALIAQHPNIIDSSDRSDVLGGVLRRASGRDMSADSMDQRITMIQRIPLHQAHKVIRTMVNAAASSGRPLRLNVEALLWMYLKWDSDAPQYPKRREVLRDYYAPKPAQANTETANITPEGEK